MKMARCSLDAAYEMHPFVGQRREFFMGLDVAEACLQTMGHQLLLMDDMDDYVMPFLTIVLSNR